MAKSWGLLGLLLVLFTAPAVGDDWVLPAPTGFVADALHHAVYEAPETWVKASPSDSVVIR